MYKVDNAVRAHKSINAINAIKPINQASKGNIP